MTLVYCIEKKIMSRNFYSTSDLLSLYNVKNFYELVISDFRQSKNKALS